MRMLLKAQLPTDSGNSALKDGSLGKSLASILADTKPEAVYFLLENGLRTVLIVFNMETSVDLPTVVEPWFLSVGATVTLTPVLNGEDFENVGPSLAAVVEKYG